MSERLRNHCLMIVLVTAGQVFTPSTLAKPPDLPINEKVDCKEQPKIPLVVADHQATDDAASSVIERVEAIDVMTPWLIEYLGHWFRSKIDIDFRLSRQAHECPFLRRETPAKTAEDLAPVGGSVLENLEKLELAQEMFKLGERCRREGKERAAHHCFAQVQSLCPGSSWGSLAARRRDEMAAAKNNHDAQVEESSVRVEEEVALPPHRRALQQALQIVADVLRDGADVDVKGPRGARLQFEVHVGGVMYKLTLDENGKLAWVRQSLSEK